MTMPPGQLERRGLLVSTAGNPIIGIVGILFAVFSSSHAIPAYEARGKQRFV